MNIQFAGKTVIVTGVAPGIGQVIAKKFCEKGAHVWGCDLDTKGLEETQKLCGSSCELREVDVTDDRAVFAFVAEAQRVPGRIDVVINNAGGILDQTGRPIEEVSRDGWDRVFAANVTGAFNFVKAVVPRMKAERAGRIVNIASGAGLSIAGLTGVQAYAAAKAALIGFTRQMAYELGPFDITVNAVAPGFVPSNAKTQAQWKAHTEERRQRILEGIYLRRLGTSDDIAHAALFFASEFSGWITGQTLSVNGGSK